MAVASWAGRPAEKVREHSDPVGRGPDPVQPVVAGGAPVALERVQQAGLPAARVLAAQRGHPEVDRRTPALRGQPHLAVAVPRPGPGPLAAAPRDPAGPAARAPPTAD